MRRHIFLISLLLSFFLCGIFNVFAGILPGDSDTILKDPSISISVSWNDPIEVSKSLWFKLLSGAKLIVSGFALIYLVLIGAYMIVFSDNEDRIKSQRKQVIYALVGFLFLNIPGAIYQIFFVPEGSRGTIGDIATDNISVNIFINSTNFKGIFWGIVSFFEIFIFWLAIISFTWGLFRLIMSAGDEEKQKMAKNRIIYGTLGLIFLGFVKVWGTIIARGDFGWEIATVGNKFLGLALYFAAPVALFFIIMAAYYYITSAWDEERTKKAKSILTNTFIASLILLATYSFFSDIAGFSSIFGS